MAEPEYSLDDAIDELQRSWSQQQCIRVEDLLQQHPDLKQNNHAVLDLIYAEVLLCEEKGLAADEADYIRRFPELQESIARQFQLHRALDDSTEQADLPTATGGMTLPVETTDHVRQTNELPQIAGFEILELAGRGGSGVAYRAYDKQLKRTVAIKLLHTMASQDDVQRQRLIREAESAASLVHPGIVRIHQIGENKGDPYLVMEFIDGRSLAEILQDGPLAPDKAIDIVVQVARAIDHAHKAGIIHRDLKPANILLDNDNQPHVCDFGLARQIASEFTLHATGDVMGTPAYMPPEQARGEGVTVASDVYSLGAVLYQCLTGRPPFMASSPWEIMTQVMTDDPPTIRQLNRSLPRDLETICSTALHKIPNRRYASAAILADELQRFRAGEPIQARPAGRVEKFWKLCKRHPAVATLVSVSLIALAALAIVYATSAERVSGALEQTRVALSEAETQRDVAFDAMKSLVYQVHDDLQQRDASVEARGQVLKSAIKGLQQILDTKGERNDIRLAMATAKSRLGFILSQQGRNDEAKQEYLEAIELAKIGDSDEAMLQAAQSCSALANFYLRTNHPDDAIKMVQQTTEYLNRRDPNLKDTVRTKLIAAQAKSHLADAFFIQQQLEKSVAARKEAIQINREILKQSPDDRKVVLQMADSSLQLGFVLINMGRPNDAEEYLTEAIELLKAQSKKSVEDQGKATTLYRALHNLGNVHFARMQFEEALQYFTEASVGYQHVVDIEPERPGFRLKLGAIQRDAGYCLASMNRIDEAIVCTTKSIQELQKGMELGGHPYRIQRFSIVGGYTTLTDLHVRRDDLPSAITALRKAANVATPIAEEYGLQKAVDGILYQAECLAGILGQDSTADPEHIQREHRSFEVYQAALSGDFQPLLDSEQQLRADIDATNSPAVKPQLILFLTQCLGLYYDFLSSSVDGTTEKTKTVQTKAIQTARQYLEQPDVNPQFYLNLPELNGLRATNEFRSAFDSP